MNMPNGSTRLQIVRTLPVGVELSGDLKLPLTAEERHHLRALFNEHGLLLFRNQRLSHDEHLDVMGSLGPVPDIDGRGHVSLDPEEGMLGSSELVFHSDSSWSPKPYTAISLMALDVVDGTTSTRFASNCRGLEAMPPEMRIRLEKLKVTEVHPYNKGLIRLDEDTLYGSPACTRPAILAHRETGRPYVYVTRMSAKRIEGMSAEESRCLIEEVFRYIYTPDNLYEHYWHRGDLLIWDNLTVQHARGNVEAAGRRYLQRVVCGEANFSDMYPHLAADPDYLKWLNAPDGHADEGVLVEVFRKAASLNAAVR